MAYKVISKVVPPVHSHYFRVMWFKYSSDANGPNVKMPACRLSTAHLVNRYRKSYLPQDDQRIPNSLHSWEGGVKAVG